MSFDYPSPKEKGISIQIILLVIGAIASALSATLIPIFFHQIPAQPTLIIHTEKQKDISNSITLKVSNNGDTIAKNIKIQLESPFRIISFNQTKSVFEKILFNKTDNTLIINIDNLYNHKEINPINLVFNPTNETILNELKIHGIYDGGSIAHDFKDEPFPSIKIFVSILGGTLSFFVILYILYKRNKQNKIKLYQLESSAKYNLSYIFAEYMKTTRNIDDKIASFISLIDFLVFILDDKTYTKEIFQIINNKIDTYLRFILYDNTDLLNFQSKVNHINTIYERMSTMDKEIPMELRNTLFDKIAEISNYQNI